VRWHRENGGKKKRESEANDIIMVEKVVKQEAE
jgi:hypothetical protein